MLSHKKDTDYLALSAWTRAKENELLTRERLDRMIEAKELGEAVKVLTQCGYSEPESLTQAGLEAMLAQERQRTFQDLILSLLLGLLHQPLGFTLGCLDPLAALRRRAVPQLRRLPLQLCDLLNGFHCHSAHRLPFRPF